MKNLLLFLLACSLGAAAAARPIRGSVKCGGKPMGGVTVTDGYTFAQSDEQGIFTLDADDQALFISLVTPSGYLAPLDGGIPQFYRAYDPAAKRYDFELQPWPGSGECYELLAIADPQPKTEEHFRRLRSEVMPALQAATDNGRTRGSNQAAIVLGDIVWDSPELFAGVKAEFAGLGVPVYGVIGNHDHDLNKYTDREATENYRRHFGPTYYAFDMGRTHYIVLDDIVYHGAKKYEEQIDTMQLRWAAAYAERLPAGSRVCIAMHAPAMKSWLGNRVMESAERLMDAFAEGLGDYDKTHKILILTTQVTYEGSDVGIYEVGKRVKNRFRFLEAHDMTIEAVVTKVMWLLAQNCDSFDQLQQRFYRQVNFDTFYH